MHSANFTRSQSSKNMGLLQYLREHSASSLLSFVCVLSSCVPAAPRLSLWRERTQLEDAAKTAESPAPVITCWHCGKATYRPKRLAWGKDLISLHDGCVGPWIDAWDAMLAARSSPEEVRSDSHAPDADPPEGSGAGRLRCEVGRFAGCMALGVARLKESKTGTTGTARDLRKRSGFGS
jgi:hypothetical protein